MTSIGDTLNKNFKFYLKKKLIKKKKKNYKYLKFYGSEINYITIIKYYIYTILEYSIYIVFWFVLI